MSTIPAPNYTQTPNAIYDIMPDMKEAELRVTLSIIRETFGWHRESKKLSIADLQKLTKLSRQGVINGTESGMERGTIIREKDGDSYRYRLCINEVDTPKEVVNEADQQTASSGQRSRPAVVNEVDQKNVNSLVKNGGAKESLKETIKTKEKSKGARADHSLVAQSAAPTAFAAPPPALTQAEINDFAEATNVRATAPPPPCDAPPPDPLGFRYASDDPPTGPKSSQQFDPRGLVGRLWPEGTGRTPYEVWRESFPYGPGEKAIRHMNATITDLDRWREHTQLCVFKCFKTYASVLKTFNEGFWEDKPKGAKYAKSPQRTRDTGEPAHATPEFYNDPRYN